MAAYLRLIDRELKRRRISLLGSHVRAGTQLIPPCVRVSEFDLRDRRRRVCVRVCWEECTFRGVHAADIKWLGTLDG